MSILRALHKTPLIVIAVSLHLNCVRPQKCAFSSEENIWPNINIFIFGIKRIFGISRMAGKGARLRRFRLCGEIYEDEGSTPAA